MRPDAPHDLLPQSMRTEEAEQAVISIILSFEHAMDDVQHLRPEHFSCDYTRAIYAALQRQIADGKGASVLTLHEELSDVVTLDELHAISECHSFSGYGIERLASHIIDRARARQLHSAADRISALAFEHGPINERLDRAQAELAKLCDDESEADWVDAYTAAVEHTALIERRETGEIGGIPTGIHDLDEMLDGGMQRGNLVIVGARPSHGKTAMGLTVAQHTSVQYPTGFLSMEMSVSEIMDRQAAALGHVPLSFIKRPAKGLDYNRILDGVDQAKRRKLFIYDRGGLTILQVRRLARKLKRRKGLEVLVVDYIGLMAGLDTKQPRAYQIEEISRGLKSLAKELDIVVLCLAQLNRAGADRAKKRPQLTDLRDSGAIEQDADVVMFIHRPEMDDPSCDQKWKGYGLLFVAKNRQGRCGDVHLHYAGEETRFSGWAGPIPTETVSSQPRTKGFGHGN